jgi:hypothetical protein
VFESTSHRIIAWNKWNTNEPNDWKNGEICVEINSGKWNDIPCTNKLSFVCEMINPGLQLQSGGKLQITHDDIRMNFIILVDIGVSLWFGNPVAGAVASTLLSLLWNEDGSGTTDKGQTIFAILQKVKGQLEANDYKNLDSTLSGIQDRLRRYHELFNDSNRDESTKDDALWAAINKCEDFHNYIMKLHSGCFIM